MTYPSRLICLSAETAELAFALGCEEVVVGVTGYAVRPPGVRRKPHVSAFQTADIPRILELKPDLVIGFSDVQADIAAGLIRAGVNTLITNQRTLAETYDAIRLVSRVLGRSGEGEALATNLQEEFQHLAAETTCFPSRPRVYFEEWDEPLIAGIGWVSEIIALCGGEDIFARRGSLRSAVERVVQPDEVIAADPQVILASWCGKKAKLARIAARPGWAALSATRSGQIHEIKSADILQPGLSLIHGARQIAAIISVAANSTRD